MKFVQLDRRFVEWRDEDAIDPELWARMRLTDGLLSWEMLLKRKRVVVLAEAGSGKSCELAEKAKGLRFSGGFAFHGTVQDVGRHGLIAALSGQEQELFRDWQASQEPGYFFVDSVDEAKLDSVKLDTALRLLSNALDRELGRCHVVLSGRHTDWEFRRDLDRLMYRLPIPELRRDSEPLAPEQALEQIVHREEPKEVDQQTELPLVVIMAGLDEERVRRFASALGVSDVVAFVKELERGHLWPLARRPLDLQWLIGYWRKNGRFGKFAEMLALAIDERSQETDPGRARASSHNANRIRSGLRRLGAALVLGHARAVAIPDSGLAADDQTDSLQIVEVLPDWNANERLELLRLPAFDPSTFGRARLHNDNEGAVRGFLAAGWLRDLRARNCSTRETFSLLFAETYGIKVVIPSMRETAAWLALWDDDVARELIGRDPFVLLNYGDPGSLSLLFKRQALLSFIDMLASDQIRSPDFDFDALRRLATPDLAEDIRRAWEANTQNAEIQGFLLRLIWLGEITGCADLAELSAFSDPPERYRSIFGGRAIIAVGDDSIKARYAEFVRANFTRLPNAAIWHVVEELFPRHLTLPMLFEILRGIDISDSDSVGSLDICGPKLAERLSRVQDLEAYIRGMLSFVRKPYGDIDRADEDSDRQFFPALVAAAERLLKMLPEWEAPEEAIDAALLFGEQRRHITRSGGEARDLADLLHISSNRRRVAFWRAAERLQGAKHMPLPFDSVWKMSHFGWSAGLKREDIVWLLEDGPLRGAEHERAMAIDGALLVWHELGRPADLLKQIEHVAGTDKAMRAKVREWTTPRETSEEMLRFQRRRAALAAQNKRERAKVTASWQYFVNELRADPNQLRKLTSPTATTVDERLHNLWRLLGNADQGRNRYGIDSTQSLKPIIGEEAALAAEDGLISAWRQWQPKVKSGREVEKMNLSYSFDCMAIAGISMEARRNPSWAVSLSDADARKAAQYATLELNGMPPWIEGLALAKPLPVREAMMEEIRAEVERANEEDRSETLDCIGSGGRTLAKLMAPDLLSILQSREDLNTPILDALLEALVLGAAGTEREKLAVVSLNRMRTGQSDDHRILYLGSAFALDPAATTTAMLEYAAALPESERRRFLQRAMAGLFGWWRHHGRAPLNLPFSVLEPLIRVAYDAIRPQDDRFHRGVFTPDERDDAESARNHLLKTLFETPGRATFDTLNRLADDPVFTSRRKRLVELAEQRAIEDSEHAPWPPEAVYSFERDFDESPRTGRELQLLTIRRLDDIQHSLMHGDFDQCQTVRDLIDESSVQNWMAERLRLMQGRAYSVEREVQVAKKKEPDIRLRARATDASVAIEIKNSESWSIRDLVHALGNQLCGSYLRDRNHRHGILLIVHRKNRARGWRAPDGNGFWSFDQVVAHLQSLAARIAGESPDAAEAEIFNMNLAETGIRDRSGSRKNDRK